MIDFDCLNEWFGNSDSIPYLNSASLHHIVDCDWYTSLLVAQAKRTAQNEKKNLMWNLLVFLIILKTFEPANHYFFFLNPWAKKSLWWGVWNTVGRVTGKKHIFFAIHRKEDVSQGLYHKSCQNLCNRIHSSIFHILNQIGKLSFITRASNSWPIFTWCMIYSSLAQSVERQTLDLRV